MYGTIMGVMEKAKALQGHTLIDNPDGYTLIGFDGLQNILNGYCSIYCCVVNHPVDLFGLER